MDDDDFGDDDLDAIPDNALQHLEQQAFTSTQSRKSNAFSAPQKPAIKTYGTSGLTRTGNANKNVWRPPQPQKQPPQLQVRSAPPASAPAPPSSDYGFDDEDIIDLDEPSMVIQPTSGLPTRARTETPALPGARNSRYGSKGPLDPETEAAFAVVDAELGAHNSTQWAQAPHLQPKIEDGVDVSSLQTRIAELEAEQARLRQTEQEARNAARAKQGEIAIVRANQEKATKEYERRIAVMQKLHADEAAKQKAELEAGRKERAKMETDNRFLQHDLAQEAERAKRLTGPGKARVAVNGNGNVTPRKAKRTALGDGFEDDEVRLVSPSKSKEKDKSREQTPKVGAKRKRPAQDSPIPVAALSFTQPFREESGESLPTSFEGLAVAKEDDRYAFMQRMLNHHPYEGHERTVEALTKHAFPSKTERSISSLLMDGVTSLVMDKEEYLPIKLSRVVLKLWSRCLEEKHYPPIYLLLDMIRFAMRSELSLTISQLIEDAVPLCVRTIDLITNSTAKASLYPSSVARADFEKFQTSVAAHIDVDEIFDFLRQLCDAASISSPHIELFWQRMNFAYFVVTLNKAQPISQITASLQILATSALPTTFGQICVEVEGAAEKQVKQERDTVDRLTSLLFEMPEVPKDEPAYPQEEIAEMRIEILEVLKTLCLTDHGSLLLAQHRSAIGRMIRFLHIQVDTLYTIRPSFGLPTPSLHSLVAQTINTTLRILYHLLRTHEESINLLQKLSVIKGGYHKFLVSMTRIAFSDKLVFEEGLEEEVVEAAHQILDSVLSPEEGEAIVRAVETPRGTKGSTTERNTSEESEEDEGVGGEGGMEEEPG